MPKVVGETAAGEAIYEVQSVRLILRAGAAHFNRIVACAKCGSDVPGPSVLNPAGLEHLASPLLCVQCVEPASAAVAPVRHAAPAAPDDRPDAPSPDTTAPAAAQRLAVDDPRLPALERRTEELARAHEHRLEQLHATFSTEAIRAGAAVDRVVQGFSELRQSQAELRVALEGRVDQLVELVQQLQARVEFDTSPAQWDSATLAQGNAELARIEEQLNQRIDGLAEQAARADDSEAERRRALEKQVRSGLRRTAKALESHRRELQAELRQQLAEVQAPVAGPASLSDNQLEALRSEIAEVRDAVKRVAGEQVDVQDRLEDLDRAPRPAAPADSGRGRKQGRKADAGANLAVAIEAAEILAREHQQLKAQVADLEKAAEAAAATAARASSLATASGPVRSDVRLLQEQLAAQNEAIATLGRTVERLRRKVSATAALREPVVKPARKAVTKAAQPARPDRPAPKATKPG